MELTIFYVINVYEPGDCASVWVLPGRCADTQYTALCVDEHPDAVKLMGPAPCAAASELFSAVAGLFRKLGYQVHCMETADD